MRYIHAARWLICNIVSQDDPHRTVQTFIELVQRHEQSFYSFVHSVHSKGESLFDGLRQWVERFLTVVREGLGDPISLEVLLPHTGQDRTDILREVDAVASYHYKLKIAYETKIRRRFGRLQGQTDADAEDEATQVLLQGVAGEINVGELARGDAIDLAAEDSDESECESSSEYESSTDEDSGSSEDSTPTPQRTTPRTAEHPATAKSFQSPVSRRGDASPANQANQGTRPRSLSLKLSRSFTSLRQLSRHTRDTPAPAVPPLPKGLSHTPTDQVPKSSTSSRSFGEVTSPPSARTREPATKTKEKRTSEALKPPELRHLPQLLPIFVEIVGFPEYGFPYC